MPHLKRGALRDFITILQANGLYKRDDHNKSNSYFKVGKSLIEFFSADNDAKLRGARRDVLYINECNNVTYEAYTQLEVRTRKKVLLDFNPVSSFWVHEKVLPLDGTKFIKSTYKDNQFLDASIIRSIEQRAKIDPNWWRVYGLGEIGTLEGTIFKNFDTVDEFPTECKWIAYGQDFGFTNDPSALIKVALKSGEIYLHEMIYDTGLTNQDLALKYGELGIGPHEQIICDSAEPKSIVEIKRMGYNAKATSKGKDSINNGIDILKRYKINVTKTSLNLIKELRNYQWQKDKDGNYINKPIDNYNHAIDAVRYVALSKIGNPKTIRAVG